MYAAFSARSCFAKRMQTQCNGISSQLLRCNLSYAKVQKNSEIAKKSIKNVSPQQSDTLKKRFDCVTVCLFYVAQRNLVTQRMLGAMPMSLCFLCFLCFLWGMSVLCIGVLINVGWLLKCLPRLFAQTVISEILHLLKVWNVLTIKIALPLLWLCFENRKTMSKTAFPDRFSSVSASKTPPMITFHTVVRNLSQCQAILCVR